MALIQVQAPDLSELAYGTATLQLLEGLGFSADGSTLLVRATYTDVADGGATLHYAMWTYDLASQQYTASLNQLIAGDAGNAADVEVYSAQIVGSGDTQHILAESSFKGVGTESTLSLVEGLSLQDADYPATLAGPDANFRIERFALSNDARFLAVQTSSSVLAPESSPDVNDMSDIYLIDLVSKAIERVSYLEGSDVFSPVKLGNVFSQGGQVSVAFSTAASFVSADKNFSATTEEAQTDAYLWQHAYEGSGLIGEASFRLLSARADGAAAGYVVSDVGVVVTAGGAFFSSTSAELVANDTNAAIDTFVNSADGSLTRVELAGLGELDSGASLLATSANGRFVALLTTSAEIAGTQGVQQLVVADLQNDDWKLFSDNDANVLADNWVTGGSLAPNGSAVAFTSLADNLGASSGGAIGGNLYAEATGYQSGVRLDSLAYAWKSHTLLSDVTVEHASVPVLTESDGRARLDDVPQSQAELLAVSRVVPAGEATLTDAAVNLTDAIAILKMIVGLDVNGAGQPLSPYQALAADFDGNGQVQLTDAIGVLKHVVGLTSPEPSWQFVDERNLDVAAITQSPLSPGQPPAILVDTTGAASTMHVGLVGYIRGDVNGSYSGPAGAVNLDETQPEYFQNLSSETGLSLSQFGVYG